MPRPDADGPGDARPLLADRTRLRGAAGGQGEADRSAYGGATLLPASETTRKEPEFEPTEKQRDDLNVDAVFAKLKTIGGKKQEEDE